MSVIDDAIRACEVIPATGGGAIGYPRLLRNRISDGLLREVVNTALRAAYPREPDAATLEAIKIALGFSGDAGVAEWTTEAAIAAYRAHPLWQELWGGRGGSDAMMADLNRARDEARKDWAMRDIGESCATCRHFAPLSPGHAAICFYRWRDLPWNAAVPLTTANQWCDGHAPRPAPERASPILFIEVRGDG